MISTLFRFWQYLIYTMVTATTKTSSRVRLQSTISRYGHAFGTVPAKFIAGVHCRRLHRLVQIWSMLLSHRHGFLQVHILLGRLLLCLRTMVMSPPRGMYFTSRTMRSRVEISDGIGISSPLSIAGDDRGPHGQMTAARWSVLTVSATWLVVAVSAYCA